MEIFIGLIVILLLIFLLTGSVWSVAAAVLVLITLFILMMLGAFIFWLLRMLGSPETQGRFVRFEKSKKHAFECAVYEIGGAEAQNYFPAEPLFRKRLYREGKDVKLRFNEKRGEVYDRSAFTTAAAGVIAFALSAAAIAYIFVSYFS